MRLCASGRKNNNSRNEIHVISIIIYTIRITLIITQTYILASDTFASGYTRVGHGSILLTQSNPIHGWIQSMSTLGYTTAEMTPRNTQLVGDSGHWLEKCPHHFTRKNFLYDSSLAVYFDGCTSTHESGVFHAVYTMLRRDNSPVLRDGALSSVCNESLSLFLATASGYFFIILK